MISCEAGVAKVRLASDMRLFEHSEKVFYCFLIFLLPMVEILQNCTTVVASVRDKYSFCKSFKRMMVQNV